ncbi:MAG: DUF2080 family transposase-associated protein [archaeon]|nr:DUF2080 family transposase-associated protein [archaeon]
MLKSFNVQEVLEKEVVSFGNGGMVYAPKKWLGKKVLLVLEERQIDIAEEILRALKPFLAEIEAVFLYGSFARKEQQQDSDIDVLVICEKKINLQKSERFDFFVVSKKVFIEKLKTDGSLFFYQIIKEAKPILNNSLLEEFKKIKVFPNFSKFFESTLTAFSKVQELIEFDKKSNKDFSDSGASIYSLILRMKSLFLIQCFVKKQNYSNKKFVEMLKSHEFSEKTINQFIEVFKAERDEKNFVVKVSLEDLQKLFDAAKLEFLKTEELVK